MRKYQQIDVYIYQCVPTKSQQFSFNYGLQLRYRMTSTFSLTSNPDWMRIEYAQILTPNLRDTHQYLLPTSCHPKHYCKNIPYSHALRLRRICSDSNMFELRAKVLTNQQHSRRYLKQDMASAIDKTRQRSRDALLSCRPKSAKVGSILSLC